jgi:thioredoxin-like negative regulator of GroEL
MHEEAAALAGQVPAEQDAATRIRALYRKVLARDPSSKEIDLAQSYLSKGTLEQYARILLSVNEEIFLP